MYSKAEPKILRSGLADACCLSFAIFQLRAIEVERRTFILRQEAAPLI
jgi:hypothetical protein